MSEYRIAAVENERPVIGMVAGFFYCTVNKVVVATLPVGVAKTYVADIGCERCMPIKDRQMLRPVVVGTLGVYACRLGIGAISHHDLDQVVVKDEVLVGKI